MHLRFGASSPVQPSPTGVEPAFQQEPDDPHRKAESGCPRDRRQPSWGCAPPAPHVLAMDLISGGLSFPEHKMGLWVLQCLPPRGGHEGRVR